MTDYTKATNFNAKDSLPSGNANKIVKGAEIDDEFDLIATAVATKSNIASPTFTGTVTGPTIVATTAFVPDASDGAALGTTSLEFSDLFLADGSIIYFGADQDTTITHVADTGLLINSTRQLQFGDSGTYIHQSADGVLDLVSDTEIEINATTIDINGAADVSGNLAVGGNLTVTGNTTISGNLTFGDAASDTVTLTADVSSHILPSADGTYNLGASGSEWQDLYIDGTANIDSLVADTADINGGTIDGATIGASSATTIVGTTITANTAFVPDASDGAALGTSSLEFSDLFLADGAVINFGDDQDVTLTHVADTGLLLSSTDQLQFGDSGTYIHQSADGVLDLVSDTEIELTATTIDINGAVAMDGAMTGGTNITISGELDAATLDISGDADIDGTLEADAITVDGTTLAEYIADTAGAMFSSNTESGITVTYQDADNTVDLAVDAAQTGITSLLATDIKIGEDDQTKIDFETADEIHFYAANAEQVYVADGVFGPQTDSDVDLGSTSVRWKDAFVDSITVTGEVDGASLDISGDADIDGTLEADAITVDGTALNEYIADTVGAMVTSNSESGITVTYQDGDNTLDFSVTGASVTNIADADSDTKIQVEESSDEDTIRMDIAGTEMMTLSSSGAVITTSGNEDTLTLTSTDADANSGPNLNLYRNSGSPADNDVLGYLKFTGVNDNSEIINYARIRTDLTDASDGTEDGSFYIFAMNAGTERTRVSVVPSETVFNDESQDVDFRVESNGSANMLFVDGGDNKVLIEGQNTASVTDSSSMQAAGVLEVNGNAGEGSDHIKMGAMADGTGNQFIEATNSGATAAYDLLLQPINGGTVGIGTTNAYDTLHISRTSTSQTAGLTLENLQAGGYGSGITWESKRSDSVAVQTAGRLYVAGQNNWASDGNADSQMIVQLRDGNTLTERLRIGSDGTFTGSASNDISDQRLKENINTITDPLEKIKALKGRTFTWKEKAKQSSGTKYGFVAQEVESVVSDLVNDQIGILKIKEDESVIYEDLDAAEEGEWSKSVQTTGIIPILVEAIKEQQTLIETLQNKVKALEEA